MELTEPKYQETLQDLMNMVETRRQMNVEYWVHRFMHKWRYQKHALHHRDGWGQGWFGEFLDYFLPTLAIIWLGYLIGELGGLVPLPGGIGGLDAGLVGTLALYHVSFAAATAAVLAYRALALVVPTALGAVAFVLLRASLARETLEISSCQPGGEVEVIGRGSVRLTA